MTRSRETPAMTIWRNYLNGLNRLADIEAERAAARVIFLHSHDSQLWDLIRRHKPAFKRCLGVAPG